MTEILIQMNDALWKQTSSNEKYILIMHLESVWLSSKEVIRNRNSNIINNVWCDYLRLWHRISKRKRPSIKESL